MTAIQICALIVLILLVGLTYWAGYRGGLIDGRVKGIDEGMPIKHSDHSQNIRNLELSLNQAREQHQQLYARYERVLATSKLGEPERQTLLAITEKLRIAAETFAAFRTGKKLERESIALREQALTMAALLEPVEQGGRMSQSLPHTGKRFDLPEPNTKTSLDAQETSSLCCAAAGITAPSSSTTEALIPHEKLRGAASPDASLTAQNGPLAQPVVGDTRTMPDQGPPQQQAVKAVQIDERAEFEREFPVPEGVQYCRQRGTYIRSPGASNSDNFAREHYAYRAGFTAWIRRASKHARDYA
ncbi:hypothetical protein [Pseudomonas moorei]|uniref:Uncharacterized protein n=1 Tax=Pseudomonas moorei TaxID=395599 RepID=A0A1H1EEY7_9PSED|nr:hypothetical protein [Pseudomonas moorei]SDQ87253.1 hypothetical protein SAMN04490195_2167 [Pseudomonas moorei]